MAKADLTAQLLRQLLHYDPETGVFTWRISHGRKRHGDAAGHARANGYVEVGVNGGTFLCHRLAWLYTHGRWPDHQIDHINGDRGDNRLSNLRDIPITLNNQNQRKAHADSSSGFLGVSKYRNRWRAVIQINGTERRVGTFDTPQQAHAAYLDAKRLHHASCTI